MRYLLWVQMYTYMHWYTRAQDSDGLRGGGAAERRSHRRLRVSWARRHDQRDRRLPHARLQAVLRERASCAGTRRVAQIEAQGIR